MTYEEKEQQRQQLRDRIGQRVKALRIMADLSQDELAQRAGLQRTHIGRIETGKYAVNIDTLQAIAEALGMTVDIIDPALQDLAPLKRLTPPIKGAIGEIIDKSGKVTETFKVGD